MTFEDFRSQQLYNKTYIPGHHRNFEIDFVLKYIPDLSWCLEINKKSTITVLDIGCTESLLLHEIEKRGYIPIGLDIRPYHANLPKTAIFFQGDITDPDLIKHFKDIRVNYAVALSTIEHIGLPCYGGKLIPNGDRLAIENIHKILDDNGYLIITVPSEYWDSNSGKGYTPKEFKKLIDGLFHIFEITHGGGQICAALVKS